MDVPAIGDASAGYPGLQSVPTAEQRTIAAMSKAKDAAEAQAAGLVALIQQAGEIGRNISVYA